MARYSDIQNARAKEEARKVAWQSNQKELKALEGKFGNIPESVTQQVKMLDRRVARFFVLTYEEFNRKFADDVTREATCVVLGEKDTKTGFPIAYIHAPEWDQVAKNIGVRAQKEGNMKRAASLLFKTSGLKATQEFCDFTRNLPAEIPFQLYFDGSRARVASLVKQTDAKMYGSAEDEIFAVEYIRKSVPTITVFVSQLDYKQEFAKKLMRIVPSLPRTEAYRISEALPHDKFYIVHEEIFSDFERYVTTMAQCLKVRDNGALRNVAEGDIVHDLLQGDTTVVMGAHSKKLAVDADDEMCSAFLVGHIINIYIPKK